MNKTVVWRIQDTNQDNPEFIDAKGIIYNLDNSMFSYNKRFGVHTPKIKTNEKAVYLATIKRGSISTLNEIKYRVPEDTRKIINSEEIENLMLQVKKYIVFNQGKAGYFDKKVTEILPTKIDKNLITCINKNQSKELLEIAYKADFNEITDLQLQTGSRLIIGLGNTSVYETDITLHHIYGLPYIPASAIKGVVRSYFIKTFFGHTKQDEQKAEKHPFYNIIFGSTSKQGSAIFIDAFPASVPCIEPDIINVHHKKYYSEGKMPSDTETPTPIIFLTVGSGDFDGNPMKFKFYIGAKNTPNHKLSDIENFAVFQRKIQKKFRDDARLIDFLHFLLKDALKNHGIGAKTSVGYGYFEETRSH